MMKFKTLLMAFLAAHLFTVQAQGTALSATNRTTAQGINPDTMAFDYYSQVIISPEGTSFSFLGCPPKGKKVLLRLYNDPLGGKPMKTVKMKASEKGGWMATVKGNWKGKFYTFDASGDKKNPRETPGVFARAVGVNGQRGAIIDMQQTNPAGWEQDKRPALKSPADLVIYEMHFRDFSVSPTSGLQYKGKFLALTEPKAINYLKELGVNAIHILPSFDYASVDETHLDKPQYNWGYDPLNYNVPEGSYSTDPYDPACRIREFKQMVQALHKAGIRVILDVVYNHTFDLDNSNFQKSWPKAYYRFNADGTPSNGSGCGNETASEQAIMRTFMKESVKYWIEEYHIDGFRFDLMGVHDIETMNQIRDMVNEIDPTIYIYGEGWSAGQCAYPTEKLAVKANTKQLNGIGAFCDDMRDALRGPFSDDHKGGFLAGVPGLEESLKFGIAGCISHPQIDMKKVNYSKEAWANNPTQMISYVSCHDDMCLVDRLRASIPGIKDDELIRLDLLAQTAVFTSQGVPFILSGEEMLRNKKGVHNSYNSPDSINELDWDNLKRYPQVFQYYKSLINLRKNHPAFRLGKAELVRQHLNFLEAPQNVVAYELKDLQGIDSWNDIIVVLNANREAKTLDIPEGDYIVVACDGVINEQSTETVKGGQVMVDGQSALILRTK
jgi:pullulanase